MHFVGPLCRKWPETARFDKVCDKGSRQSGLNRWFWSKGVTGETEFIVIGSQAILGPFPDAPPVLRLSMEADLYPRYRRSLLPSSAW